MKLLRLRTILIVPVALFVLFYVAAAARLALDDRVVEPYGGPVASQQTVAIFGASGTAGDGILKAAMTNPDIGTIHVVTRRVTPRMEEGVAMGKVLITTHTNYLDYSAIRDQVAECDAVYWAIGLSSVGVDEKTYRMIHVDFPLQFVSEWLSVGTKPGASFHYISSSDISEDSSMMWARVKVRAENSLFALAEDTTLRIIAYRPDYIGPTREEAHPGQDLLYWFFAPVGVAVKATQIGEAMMEVTARGPQYDNGARLATRSIVRHSSAYLQRVRGQ